MYYLPQRLRRMSTLAQVEIPGLSHVCEDKAIFLGQDA